MSSHPTPPSSTTTPTFLNPRAPPPPPKASSASTNQPAGSGPRPPPPPSPLSPQSQTSTQSNPVQFSHPPPPSDSNPWLPESLLSKQYITSLPQCLYMIDLNRRRTSSLESLLQSPSLLTALSAQHSSLKPSPLPPHLSQTLELALHVQAQHAHLLAVRQRTQDHLLHLHALNHTFHQTQSQLDRALEPWSPKALYQRLVAREREGEEWARGMEESFLNAEDGMDGKISERELEGFLRGWREGRRKGLRRMEERARWDEGRVGGWR